MRRQRSSSAGRALDPGFHAGERAGQQGLAHLFEQVLVPTEKVVEVRRGRKVDTERKFFPGYVLVKVDLTDVSKQVQGFYNSGEAAGRASCEVAFKCLTSALDLPINDGQFRALEIVLPPLRERRDDVPVRVETIPVRRDDRVIAVVNDEALTQYDVNEQKRVVLGQMKAQSVTPPAVDVLEKQVLERLITERVLLQYAKETGIRVDDTQVERTLARIAEDNKLSAEDFRKAVEREGIPYPKYRADIRNEILIQRLRDREVEGRVSVSDAEVDHMLATLESQAGGQVEYRLAHILVLVPDQASSEQIGVRQRRAEAALQQLRTGADFAQVAASFSEAPDAVQGGAMGWRELTRLPSIFAEARLSSSATSTQLSLSSSSNSSRSIRPPAAQ